METTTEKAVEMLPSSAEQFMKEVRRKTRKKWSADEKIRIVLEGMKREIPVSELCRREGVPTTAYYSWVKDFMESGKAGLKRDGAREANRSEVEKLRKENEKLKALIGEKELVIDVFKKSLDE